MSAVPTETLDLVLGTVQIGTWACYSLFSIELLMFWKYFANSGRKDSWLLWGMMVSVLASDCIATGDQAYWVYHYCVRNWGNTPILATQGAELPVHNITVSWTAICCQLYLAYRFYKISKNLYIYLFIVAVSLAAQGSALYISVIELQNKAVSDRDLVITAAIVWLSLEAAADILISLALTFYLVRFGKQTTFTDTKAMLQRLILLALESGTFSSAIALATLIAAKTALTTNICILFVFVLGRVYSLTLLYNLNIRATGLLSGESTHIQHSKGVETFRLGAVNTSPNNSSRNDFAVGGNGRSNYGGVSVQQATHVVMEQDLDHDEKESVRRFKDIV